MQNNAIHELEKAELEKIMSMSSKISKPSSWVKNVNPIKTSKFVNTLISLINEGSETNEGPGIYPI